MHAYLWGLALLFTFHFPVALPLPNNLFLPIFPLVFFIPLAIWRRPKYSTVFAGVLIAVVFVLVTISYSDLQIADFWRRFRSGIQLCYILVVTLLIATSRPFSAEESSKLGRFLLYTAAGIVILGVLEILTPFREVSDAFRAGLYTDALNYQNDARDFGIAGYVRPKVFTSEPSHAAWSVCQLALCALAILPSRRMMIGVITILVAGTLVFVSPTMPITCVAVIIIGAIPLWGDERYKKKGLLWGTTILCALGLGGYFAYDLFSDRFDVYLGTDDSIYLRIMQPFGLAYTALKYNFALGVGFGGLESIWNDIRVIEGGASVENLNQTPGMALLTIPLYSGALGCIMFCGVVFWIRTSFVSRLGLQVILVLIFTMLQKSSFVITTAWLVTAIWCMQAQGAANSASLKRGFNMWSNRATSSQPQNREPRRHILR